MSRSLALFGIGLVFGSAAGFLAAASQGITLDGHDHADPGAHGAQGGSYSDSNGADGIMAHGDHAVLTLPDDAIAPTLAIAVTQDPVSGWNLQLKTENFRFAPESAGLQNRPGEGHAHVYVNDVKLARLYGSWMHLPALPTGQVELRVTLNANDHSPLAVGDRALSQIIMVDSATAAD